MSDIDAEIKLIRKGDDDAFRRLLDKFAPLISALADKYSRQYKLLGLSVEDIFQEASIALYSAALTYKIGGEVTFGLYAKVCIKNRLISYIRKNASKVITEQVTCDIEEYSDKLEANPDEQPQNSVVSDESLDTLRKKIKSSLSDYEYKVFMMYSDNVSIKEIARSLGKTVKSIYSTISRVRNKLKKTVTF